MKQAGFAIACCTLLIATSLWLKAEDQTEIPEIVSTQPVDAKTSETPGRYPGFTGYSR
jgi:hypothetical protein